MPKISEVSPLLQEIYDDVCNSDCQMCYITYDDWKESDYNNKNFKTLKNEIEKYQLKDIISLLQDDCKIIGYGDLELRFIDDRHYNKRYDDYEIESMKI